MVAAARPRGRSVAMPCPILARHTDRAPAVVTRDREAAPTEGANSPEGCATACGSAGQQLRVARDCVIYSMDCLTGHDVPGILTRGQVPSLIRLMCEATPTGSGHQGFGRGWTPARSRSSRPATVPVTRDSLTKTRIRHLLHGGPAETRGW